MEINNSNDLIEAINICKSIEQVNELLKQTLKTQIVIIMNDTTLEEVQKKCISYVEKYSNEFDRPLLITFGTEYKTKHIY